MLVKRELLVSERFVSGEWKRGGSRNGYSFQNPEKKKKTFSTFSSIFFFFPERSGIGGVEKSRIFSWPTERDFFQAATFYKNQPKKTKQNGERKQGWMEGRSRGAKEKKRTPNLQKFKKYKHEIVTKLSDSTISEI